MTVSAPAKLEALHRLLRSAPRVDGDKAAAASMRRSSAPPEAMAPDFSGVGRAVEVYYAKIPAAERSVLTAGVDAACLKS